MSIFAWEEVALLRKRKEPKRKSIALTLMRDVQGTAADKLAMFQKVRPYAAELSIDGAEALIDGVEAVAVLVEALVNAAELVEHQAGEALKVRLRHRRAV
jgi:hypothetical protein